MQSSRTCSCEHAAIVTIHTNNRTNARSLRTSLTDSFGGSQAYAYDGEDRLDALTTNAGNVVSLTYDAAGRPIGITFPNGIDGSAAYETDTGRLSALAFGNAAVDLFSSTYCYNAVGNITAIDEAGQIGVRARRFSYDELQRLVSGGTDSLLRNRQNT